MAFNPRDHYFKKAKENNYVARSIFKLEEIDQKFHVFKAGQKVLDLGASPGSWSQYASKKIGDSGKILGIDLSDVNVKLKNGTFIKADIRDIDLIHTFEQNGFDGLFHVVMSDMAPKTTGIKLTDQMRSLELCEIALEAANKFLIPNGTFICKLFHSDNFAELKKKIKDRYQRVEAIKPDSTRKESKEIFLVGIKKRESK